MYCCWHIGRGGAVLASVRWVFGFSKSQPTSEFNLLIKFPLFFFYYIFSSLQPSTSNWPVSLLSLLHRPPTPITIHTHTHIHTLCNNQHSTLLCKHSNTHGIIDNPWPVLCPNFVPISMAWCALCLLKEF